MGIEDSRQCPSCRFESQEAFKDCPMCGLIIKKHNERLASDPEYKRITTERINKDIERKKKEAELNEPVRCPKCKSNQIHFEKKGYGIGKGLVGLVALGPLGLAAGAIGKDKLLSICIKCGHKW